MGTKRHIDAGQTVIFTDLDGTLLDLETYSCGEASSALDTIRTLGIPLVFCSSKTQAEQEIIRREIGIKDPLVVEDGGAIYIPVSYFSQPYEYQRSETEYNIIELGTPYNEIRHSLRQAASISAITLQCFGDMTSEEIAAVTGLDPQAAARAGEREYEETIASLLEARDLDRLNRELARYCLVAGRGSRFIGVRGTGSDKGKAVSILSRLYRNDGIRCYTIGIGDGANDETLLGAVDLPVLVQRPGGEWLPLDLPGLVHAEGVGPIGWNVFITSLFSGQAEK